MLDFTNQHSDWLTLSHRKHLKHKMDNSIVFPWWEEVYKQQISWANHCNLENPQHEWESNHPLQHRIQELSIRPRQAWLLRFTIILLVCRTDLIMTLAHCILGSSYVSFSKHDCIYNFHFFQCSVCQYYYCKHLSYTVHPLISTIPSCSSPYNIIFFLLLVLWLFFHKLPQVFLEDLAVQLLQTSLLCFALGYSYLVWSYCLFPMEFTVDGEGFEP